MIARLIRQDPTRGNLRITLPMALLTGMILRVLIRGHASEVDPLVPQLGVAWVAFVALFVWYLGLMILISGNLSTRCNRLSLSLPIAARTLWLARMSAMLIGPVVPLVVATLTAALRTTAFGAGGPWFDSGVLLIGAQLGAAYLLVLMICQSPSPGLYQVRRDARHWIGAVGVFAAVAVLLGLTMNSRLSTALLLAAGLLLALRIYRMIPASLSLAPAALEGAVARIGSAGAREPELRSHRVLQRMIWRTLNNHPLWWLLQITILGYGFLLASAYHTGRDVWFHGMAIVAWMYALTYHALGRLHRIDHLPIGRRLLAAHTLLPLLGSAAIGVGLGVLVETSFPQRPQAQIRVDCDGLRYPSEFMEIDWDGETPATTAPWGETYRPRALPIVPGARFAVYDPFAYDRGSSVEFAAYQAERAAYAIHGGRAPESWFDRGQVDGCFGRLVGCRGFPIHRGEPSPPRSRTFAVGLLLGALVAGGFMTFGMLQFSARAVGGVVRPLLAGMAILVLSLILAGVVLEAVGYTSFEAIMAFPYILMRKLAARLPLGNAVLWLVAVCSVGVAYLVVQERYRRVEAPLNLVKPFMREH